MEEEALRVGMSLGRYTLVRVLARGGMALVWAARLAGGRGFAKLVAVKVILPEFSKDPEYERMFLDEARVASSVQHSNVCEIFELGKDKGRLFMAMEFVNGDSLSSLIQATGGQDGLPLTVATKIIADACAGLHAVHEAVDDNGNLLNVIHRDVSPHNILISAEGHVKLADFGVAKAAQQLHHRTKTGQVKGKVCYIAPEQLMGATFDRRSDIFSMGCVLYQATVGRRPFRAEDDHVTMRQIIQGDYELPGRQRSDYPRALESIICRALATNPNDRFGTADEMARALNEYLAHDGTMVRQAQIAAIMRERLADSLSRKAQLARDMVAFVSSPEMAAEPPSQGIPGAVEDPATSPGAPESMRKARAAGAITPERSETSGPALTVSAPDETRPARPSRRLGIALLGALAALALAGWVLSDRTRNRAAAVERAASIQLDVRPSTARVFVDERDRGTGNLEVPRPPKGTLIKISIACPDHEPATLTLSDESPSLISVKLAPQAGR